MKCKVNNRITPLEVRNTTPEEEDTEAEEEVEEHLAEDEDRSSVIIADNKVTLHETVRRLPVPIAKLPIMILKNVQFIRIEQWTPDPTVNVVMHSDAVTSGQPTKPSGAWARKIEDKQPAVDMDKIKETLVHASTKFCIPDPPSMKGKEPQVPDKSIGLRSDWKASTSTAVCQEIEPASNINSFLQSFLKLIRDENA